MCWWCLGMTLGIVLLLAAIVLVAWVLFQRLPGPATGGDSAEDALRTRFARGEISPEEYERTLEVLRRSRPAEKVGA